MSDDEYEYEDSGYVYDDDPVEAAAAAVSAPTGGAGGSSTPGSSGVCLPSVCHRCAISHNLFYFNCDYVIIAVVLPLCDVLSAPRVAADGLRSCVLNIRWSAG